MGHRPLTRAFSLITGGQKLLGRSRTCAMIKLFKKAVSTIIVSSSSSSSND
jgi:hypothetical protein